VAARARRAQGHLKAPNGRAPIRAASPSASSAASGKVLDRPEIRLHTNCSENDIRCQVIRRKISGGTRSDAGRDCRDAFLGLAKTCAKLGIAFWDYLGARLLVPGSATIPFLPEIVSVRAAQPPPRSRHHHSGGRMARERVLRRRDGQTLRCIQMALGSLPRCGGQALRQGSRRL
jgi:hypothetical protein